VNITGAKYIPVNTANWRTTQPSLSIIQLQPGRFKVILHCRTAAHRTLTGIKENSSNKSTKFVEQSSKI